MIYTFWKIFFRAILYVFCGFKVHGLENIPKSGPVLIVCNHISYWDPIVVGVAMPRKVFFMAKKELFAIPLLGFMIKHMGAFPVNRGGADRAAIKIAIRHLKEQKIVGIFPEGMRSKDGRLLPFQTGVTALALKNNAYILPVAVKGTKNPFSGFWFRPVEVKVGKPRKYDASSDQKEVTKELESIVAEMLG